MPGSENFKKSELEILLNKAIGLVFKTRHNYLIADEAIRLCEVLKQHILCSANVESTRPVSFFHVRAHRIHNLENYFEIYNWALKSLINKRGDKSTYEIDTFQFINIIHDNPLYIFAVSFFLAIRNTIIDLNEYRFAKSRIEGNRFPNDEDRKGSIARVEYLEELLGENATLVEQRLKNLFDYFYNLFKTDPQSYIEITVTPDGMCQACPVKLGNLNIGPHCISKEGEATEDEEIIGNIVLSKLAWENLNDFTSKFLFSSDKFTSENSDQERIDFAVNFLTHAMRNHQTLYTVDLYSWGQMILIFLKQKGITQDQNERCLQKLLVSGVITQFEYNELYKISSNIYVGGYKMLDEEAYNAIVLEPIIDEGLQLIKGYRVFIQQWLLFDKDFAYMLDVHKLRHHWHS